MFMTHSVTLSWVKDRAIIQTIHKNTLVFRQTLQKFLTLPPAGWPVWVLVYTLSAYYLSGGQL